MARYFFDLHNGDGHLRDEAGLELATKADILKEMSRILLDIARDEMPVVDRTVISIVVRADDKPISVASLIFSNEWLE
ncbi:DUF6894 family protein [Rhizobium binxianense]